MEASVVINKDKSTLDDKELERLAVESLLDDVRRRKSRVEKVGTMGWVKERNVNKRFLNSLVLQTLPRHTTRPPTQNREQPARLCTQNREHRQEATSERSGRHRTKEYRHRDTLRTKDDRSREQSSSSYHNRERSRSREREKGTSMADSRSHTRDTRYRDREDDTRSKNRQEPSRNLSKRQHRHFDNTRTT